jgi:hypothetical protein
LGVHHTTSPGRAQQRRKFLDTKQYYQSVMLPEKWVDCGGGATRYIAGS